MTPKQRLDQIEPVLADVARKTDRLIEITGQTFDIATRSLHNSEEALQMSRQALGVSTESLGISTEALGISTEALDTSKQALDISTKSLDSSTRNEISIDRVATGLATLTTATQANFERMQQDINGLKEGQSKSEQTQQEILKLLRDMR